LKIRQRDSAVSAAHAADIRYDFAAKIAAEVTRAMPLPTGFAATNATIAQYGVGHRMHRQEWYQQPLAESSWRI